MNTAIRMLAAVATLLACGNVTATKHQQTPSRDAAVVTAIWNYYEGSLQEAMKASSSGSFDSGSFSLAIDFFEGVTGIPSNTGTYVGRLPSPELAEANRRWEAWFAANHNRLQFSPGSCKILVREDAVGTAK